MGLHYSLNTHVSFDTPLCELFPTGDAGRGFRREIVHVALSPGERQTQPECIFPGDFPISHSSNGNDKSSFFGKAVFGPAESGINRRQLLQ